MAKISFVKQLLFGSTGSASKFGQPGSINTTKTNTKDRATIQSLSAFLSGLEDIVLSGSYKIAIEDLNSLFLLAFTQIAYIQQAGVCEWSTDVTYYAGSIVNLSGALYKSTTDDNTGNNPASSASNWILISGDAPGFTKDFAGPAANIPSGYLVCDGSAVSRATYPNLFAAIGTYWGTGDGSTTFNTPDFRGMTTIGLKSSDTEMNAVGKTLGAKTHTLTVTEMPPHSHTLNRGDFGGGVDAGANATGTGITTSVSGGGQAHNNMQPSAVVLKLIKY